MEEVDKLLVASFMWEVYYPEWLANVIMVKKIKWEIKDVLTSQSSIKHVQKTASPYQGSTS